MKIANMLSRTSRIFLVLLLFAVASVSLAGCGPPSSLPGPTGTQRARSAPSEVRRAWDRETSADGSLSTGRGVTSRALPSAPPVDSRYP